jgi:hypothetical protein
MKNGSQEMAHMYLLADAGQSHLALVPFGYQDIGAQRHAAKYGFPVTGVKYIVSISIGSVPGIARGQIFVCKQIRLTFFTVI